MNSEFAKKIDGSKTKFTWEIVKSEWIRGNDNASLVNSRKGHQIHKEFAYQKMDPSWIHETDSEFV